MGIFESYLEEFSQSISLIDFIINLIVAAILCLLLRLFYVRFGNAVSNRSRFASNFLPLGLTTLLIITIVKSSIALSLGLVGALSIVRFRAAIKDPEELTYLFLCIAIGLAAGANQILIALIAFVFIMGLLFLNHRLGDKKAFKREERMYLNIYTDVDDLTGITDLLTTHLPYVELKRLDKQASTLALVYVIQSRSMAELETIKKALMDLSPNTTLSMVDQPDLVV